MRNNKFIKDPLHVRRVRVLFNKFFFVKEIIIYVSIFSSCFRRNASCEFAQRLQVRAEREWVRSEPPFASIEMLYVNKSKIREEFADSQSQLSRVMKRWFSIERYVCMRRNYSANSDGKSKEVSLNRNKYRHKRGCKERSWLLHLPRTSPRTHISKNSFTTNTVQTDPFFSTSLI